MPDVPTSPPVPALAQELLDLTARLGGRADEDPFGNPVLLVSLAITRQMDNGSLSETDISSLIRHLRDAAFVDRAGRIANYVGGIDKGANDGILAGLAQHLLRPDPNDSPVRWAEYRALTERTRVSRRCLRRIRRFPCRCRSITRWPRQHAAGRLRRSRAIVRHRSRCRASSIRPSAAIANGRDAIDRFNAALISVARGAWADRWTELTPSPVVLSSWVGYDTDGRTDIGWWDTLRLRLEMKRLQLARLHAQISVLPSARGLAERVAEASAAVDRQIALCPDEPEPVKVAAFARAMVGRAGYGTDLARAAAAAVPRSGGPSRGP